MPISENHPAANYEKRYFNARATAKGYERDLKKPETVGWNRFMMSRRLSDFTRFVFLQEARIHHVVGASMGNQVNVFCACGLSVSHPAGTDYEQLPFYGLGAFGHWDHLIGDLAQVFVLNERLVCAGCDLDEAVEYDDPEAYDREPIVDWDAVLKAHAGCGFARF
jgi:hypothetical protein